MARIPVNHHRQNSSVESKREQFTKAGPQKKMQDLTQKKEHVRAASLNFPSVKLSRKPGCNQLIADLLGHLSSEKAESA
jgi:hypothetical protein